MIEQRKRWHRIDKQWDSAFRFIFTRKKTKKQHNGRGSQEAIFGDAENDAALDAIPAKRLAGNLIFTLCAMMAHNLSRELQMPAAPSASRALPKRPVVWTFEKPSSLKAGGQARGRHEISDLKAAIGCEQIRISKSKIRQNFKFFATCGKVTA